MASISIGVERKERKRERERRIVHFISICVNIPFASKQTTLCSYCFLISRICKYLVSKFSSFNMRITTCVCEWVRPCFQSNRKLYVRKLMIVSPLHPAYLSSLRVLWEIAKCLETMPTCVNFDGQTAHTLSRCIKQNTDWILCAVRLRSPMAFW